MRTSLQSRPTTHRMTLLLWAAVQIPLQNQGSWQVLTYKNRPAHHVSFSQAGMKIEVRASAGPLIFPLPQAASIKTISLRGGQEGKLNLPAGVRQGDRRADDFTLRVGLVVKGDKRLSRIQSWLAPEWIKRLHGLAPPGAGIDHIEFFNFVQDLSLLGHERRHPSSDLLLERFKWALPEGGPFKGDVSLPKPLETLALWLAADGDDSKSNFTVILNELSLQTAD